MVWCPFWMSCHGNVTARDVGWIWMTPTLAGYAACWPYRYYSLGAVYNNSV